jgi:subtilisin family serine protease
VELHATVTPAYRPDRILIQPNAQTDPAELAAFHESNAVQVLRSFPAFDGIQVLQVPRDTPVEQWIERYRASGLVAFAQPDHIATADATFPTDPGFANGAQWNLNNLGQDGGVPDADIDAPEAWDLTRCASNIIVALLDTGIRHTHEDLAANMWTNQVDGSPGYNAFTGNNDPIDDDGHGTRTAGVLGSVGDNGIGTCGVAWSIQMMACKCLDAHGYGSDSTVIASLDFARTNGARIINASLGISMYSIALSNAIATLRDDGILLVVSAGNNGTDLDNHPRYPACYDIDNIVSVAYTSRDDTLGLTSNFGATNVDLAAPGDGIFSTDSASDSAYFPADPLTQNLVGSSFAAAHVSGALALIMSRFPDDPPDQVLGRIMNAVDRLPDLDGKCRTSGRLNLRKALSPDIELTTLGADEEGNVLFDIRCGPNRTCVIESSTDFLQWEPAYTNSTTTNFSFAFSTPGDSTGVPRYFRAVSDP